PTSIYTLSLHDALPISILGAMDSWRRRSAIGAHESAERAAHYLAGDPCVQLVYGFGSATQRDRATVRDVDLAVLTDPPLTQIRIDRKSTRLNSSHVAIS